MSASLLLNIDWESWFKRKQNCNVQFWWQSLSMNQVGLGAYLQYILTILESGGKMPRILTVPTCLFWYLMNGKQNVKKKLQTRSFNHSISLQLCLCLWWYIHNLSFTFILTLSRSERVAFKAPSGRPNGKQYLKKRKFFKLLKFITC